jgi:hypothetical protein
MNKIIASVSHAPITPPLNDSKVSDDELTLSTDSRPLSRAGTGSTPRTALYSKPASFPGQAFLAEQKGAPSPVLTENPRGADKQENDQR